MPLSELSEADIVSWIEWFDDSETARVAKFRYARNRIEFAAAHALARH